jgi:5-methyltetrahydrofolate--homocysteine methyltransferase
LSRAERPEGPPPSRPDRVRSALDRGPLLLDAGMGTRLIGLGLDLSIDDPCLWNLDRPESVLGVHRLDVAAGADALTTNTFGANARWLARFGREGEAAAINRAAVALAREAAGPDRFVLGDIGPTAGASEVDQARALASAGADALILETNSVREPIGPRLDRLHRAVGLPMIVTFAVGLDDRPLPPLVVEDQGAMPAAVGWNCIPAGEAEALVDRASERCPLPLAVQPNGPLPEGWPATLPGLIRRGVLLVGGCCGTTDADLAAMRTAIGPPAIGGAGPRSTRDH